jgi:DnaJ-domain-containing protein 1
MSIGSSKLSGTPQSHREQLATYVKLLLLWVAASDGKLEESELEYASAQFPDSAGTITTDDFLAVIRNSDLETIEKAIRFIAAESRELRTAFLDMAVTMCMADRDIAIAENHILRFYADALHLGIGNLQKRFQAITGGELAEPGDPGSPDWWAQTGSLEPEQDAESEGNDDARPQSQASADQPGSGMTIARAHAVLGLSLNATQADIERAYQNLVGIFQVDRVEAMGEAAVTVANARFKKIQEAYRLLRA